MPIQTNTRGEGGGEKYPSLKFPEVGDKAVIRLCHASVVPMYVFGSNPRVQATKADGSPKEQVKLVGHLMTAGKTTAGDGTQTYAPLEVGATVSLYISGHNRYTSDEHRQSWGQATDVYGNEPYIGDVIQIRRDNDEPGAGAAPKRCMWFNVVAQDPSVDGEAIKAAEATYHEIEGTPQP